MTTLNHTAVATLICEITTAAHPVNSDTLTQKLQALLPELDLQGSPLVQLLVKKDLGKNTDSWLHHFEAGGWTK